MRWNEGQRQMDDARGRRTNRDQGRRDKRFRAKNSPLTTKQQTARFRLFILTIRFSISRHQRLFFFSYSFAFPPLLLFLLFDFLFFPSTTTSSSSPFHHSIIISSEQNGERRDPAEGSRRSPAFTRGANDIHPIMHRGSKCIRPGRKGARGGGRGRERRG